MADLEGVEDKSGNVAKDLFSGAMGGIAQVLLGMCFFLVFVIFGFVLTSHSCFLSSLAHHVHRRIMAVSIVGGFITCCMIHSNFTQVNHLISSKSVFKPLRSTPMP